MKKIAIILIAAALFACKKDDPVSSLTITSDTSMDFLPGQTKEITYTSAHIVRHNAPTAPTGWSVRQDGKRYLVTAPSGADGEAVGTIKINVAGINNVTLSRSVSVAVRTAEEISGRARSIVVTEADRRFRFAVSLVGAVRAERLWSTSKTAVRNVSYEDGFVYFATGTGDDFEPANALIAVMDKNDNVLDSWHIWASKEQPAAVQVGGYLVMDRNLGALSERDFGLYYQWGRPAPFAGPVTLYNHKGSVTTHSFATDEGHTLAYGVAHPGTFIAGVESLGFDWQSGFYYGTDNPEWDADYNPCPEGWKMAPTEVYKAFSRDAAVGTYDGGWTFSVGTGSGTRADDGAGSGSGEIFFPAAGRRSFSPSLATWKKNYTNVVNDPDGNGSPVGFYWTVDGDQSFAFDKSQIVAGPLSDATEDAAVVDLTADPARIYRAGGFSVRCIEDRWR